MDMELITLTYPTPRKDATVDDYGNTASTTLFLALHRYLDEHRFARGDKVLLLSVASGLEVGIALLVLDDLVETHGHTN